MRHSSKTKHCVWCDANSGSAAFCGVCYPLLDGSVKGRITAAFKFGSPKRALSIGIEALEALEKSGVPVPARKTFRAEFTKMKEEAYNGSA